MAKVLLVNPPMLTEQGNYLDGYQGVRPKLPPLGLAYIASMLEKHGHRVRIIEGMAQIISPEEIAQISESFDIVGISSITFLALLSHNVAKAVKKQNKKVPVVMGGPHASVVPEDVLRDENIDYLVIGEGEATFSELVESLAGKRNAGTIKGIGYRKDNGTRINELRPTEDNLDAIPLPARHLLPMHLYRSSEVRAKRHPALHMMSSRGCPYNCSFCSNKITHRCRLRLHSPERVVEEMTVLAKDFRAKEIHFWDDCFVFDKERVYEICRLIHKNRLTIPWECEATIPQVEPDLLKEMRHAGCFGVSYGIETGYAGGFKRINKSWLSCDEIRKAIVWTRQAGLRARGYFMFGFPQETLQEMEQTIRFAKELDLDFATFSLLVPLPGTEDYERAKKEGQFDPYYWRHTILSEISFPREPAYVPKGLDRDQLLQIHRRACREFYFRPKVLLKRLRDLRSATNLLGSLKGAMKLLWH
ncbi:MAG: radical SAM protein [Candidatus Aureabacteria bacterium]|nr:radical SAM protein [Candidatus Auribacterota bacterium]